MQGRDGAFGNILENIMANVEAADAQEAKIKEMVEFYGKVLEGSTPHDAILKLAEEHSMKPEEVFELLKAGGHVNVETLDELKVEEAKKKAKAKDHTKDKATELKTKDGADTGKLKAMEAKDKETAKKAKKEEEEKKAKEAAKKKKAKKDEGRELTEAEKSVAAEKISQPKPEKVKELPTKGGKDTGKLTKMSDGKVPEEGKDSEADKIKKLTEEFQKLEEGALAKEVDSLTVAAKKALDADEYDTAMDLVSRLSQVQAALPAKMEPAPKPLVVDEPKEDELKDEEEVSLEPVDDEKE